MRILLVLLLGCLQVDAQSQDSTVYSAGEISRFDSLLQYNQIPWHLTESEEQLNSDALSLLGTHYPKSAVTKEVAEYEVNGIRNRTTRWIQCKNDTCTVYEKLVYGWGGEFGYINGVRVRTTGEFDAALKNMLEQ